MSNLGDVWRNLSTMPWMTSERLGTQADDLRAGLEVAKWGAFRHSTTLGRRPRRFKTVCSDSAAQPVPRPLPAPPSLVDSSQGGGQRSGARESGRRSRRPHSKS
jgi:hypothetical protein